MMIEDTRAKINQVADTYFKYEPARSKFLEDMEYNMKAYSGIDPSISSEEISKQRNVEQEQDLTAATENVLTQVDYNNPETLNSIMQNYRTYGTLLKSNPSTAIIESFVDNEVADRIFSNEVYRINATNTDQDYPLYMTRGAIFEEQLIDHLQNDNPSLYSFTKRFITPPVLSMTSNLLKGSAGVFLAHGLTAAYDVSQLGDSIYNTQKKYINWRNTLLDDKTLTYDKFQEESKKLFDDIVTNVPEEYRYEIYKALREGADPFADGGLSFSGLGFETGVKPISGTYRAAKGMINKVTPLNKSMNVKNMQFNEELGDKIAKMSTNKVDENVVDEIVEIKNTATKPAEVSPEMEDVVKGIIRNKEIDENLLQNSNNDRVLPGLSVSQEDIAAHNSLTSGENRVQAVEEAFNKRQAINARREKAGQRGEIRLEEPEQSYFIDHGRGVDDLPMTYEEALREMNRLQGRKFPVLYRERSIWGDKLEDVSDYVAVTTASRTPWESLHVEYRPGTGERSQSYGGGMYATFVDSDWEAARRTYLPNAQEVSDKAVLNTHYIPNPEKHPEMYLYYDNENPGLKPFAINIMNVKSDKHFKIAEKQQETIRSAVKDIEKGLQERIQKAIKEGNTDLVNTLQFDHQFLLDHYDGDFNIFTWSDYLRENVYGLDKPSQDFRAWEKEYWKNKGVKGLIHEGDGSTSTNIVIFDESITKPVTKVETKTEQIGYDNAHMIVSAGDGVGYYVRELHGVKDAKPMIIKSGKVVDFGDYKPYNSVK